MKVWQRQRRSATPVTALSVINATRCPVYLFKSASGGPASTAVRWRAISSTWRASTSGDSWTPSWSTNWVHPSYFECGLRQYLWCFVYLKRIHWYLLDGNQRSGTPWNVGGSFDWRRTGRVGRGIQNRIAQQFRREIVFGRRVPTGFGSLPIRRLSVQQRIRHRLRGQILPIKSVFNKWINKSFFSQYSLRTRKSFGLLSSDLSSI